MQSWTKKDMTFVPFTNLLEFIPESEMVKIKNDRNYKPRTLLLSEVEPDKRYELVITNFHRMPFVRYRLGHLIKITSLQDEDAKIFLPQMVFEGRADELIDIASFTRLSEKTITQAIANTGVGIEGWSIRKEVKNGNPILALYAEFTKGQDVTGIALRLHKELKKVDLFYDDLDAMMDIQPIEVIMLQPGTFGSYYTKSQNSGVELSQRQPPRINAPNEVIDNLIRISKNLEVENTSGRN